jgi:ribosome biogenesis GTPase A
VRLRFLESRLIAEQLPAEKLKEIVDGYAPSYRMFPLLTDSSSPFAHATTPAESIEQIKSVVTQSEGKVAIVGAPFVGKSLLFAELLDISPSRKSTESLRSRELTPSTTLIDTPPLAITSLDPLHALLGYTNPTFATIEDLVLLLHEGPQEYWAQLEQLYGIPALMKPIRNNRYVHPAKDLCIYVARKFGRLGKGGPNIQAAVEIITEDCLKGKLRWFLD